MNEQVSSSESSNFSPKVTQVVNERSSGSSSSSLRLPCLHEKERIADCHKKQKTTTRTSANLASSKLTTGQAGISFGDQESEFDLDRPHCSRIKIKKNQKFKITKNVQKSTKNQRNYLTLNYYSQNVME